MTQTVVARAIQEELVGNQPEKKFRAGGVSATVWKNQAENGEYRTISIERNYKDKDGNWKTTNSFRVNDLPKLALLGAEVYKFVVYNEQVGA